MTNTIIAGVIVALISAAISLAISHFSARSAVKKEMEKMKLAWQREDSVVYEKEFSEMADIISRYILSNSPKDQKNALGKVGYLRSKRSGNIAFFLDEMYQELLENDIHSLKDTLEILVDEERKQKFGQPANSERKKHRAKAK